MSVQDEAASFCDCDFAPAGHTEYDCAGVCATCRANPQSLAAISGLCVSCKNDGEQRSATCFRCNGRQVWQLHDGSVEECPACAEEVEDPDACVRCGYVEDVPLVGGVCRSCDYEEALQDGYVPSYLGVRSGPAA